MARETRSTGGKIVDLPLLMQVLAFSAAIIGGYVALESRIAVLTEKVASLERNAAGLEQYLMDLYRQERHP